MHERHVNFTQCYRFDFHERLQFVSEHRFSDAINPSADGPQCSTTAGLRPTLPAEIAHSRVRRAHSRAHSVPLQTPGRTAPDCSAAPRAPACESPPPPSIRRSLPAPRCAHDTQTPRAEHPPAPLRPFLTSSTTPPPTGRWAAPPATETT